jgi:DNA-directed RNA polymerase subunit alpha
MQITFPSEPKILQQDENKAVFEIEGCYPGYGITLGNALRRVLLSSLPGAAITGFKINGVHHEFSTIPGVLETAVDIILNLKQVRLKTHADGPVKIFLKGKGEKTLKAKDIQATSDVEIINKDAHIVTLTDKKAELDMEIEVCPGLGYEPVDMRKKERLEIGKVAIDAIFSPVKKVNFEVKNMRVGDRTDYNLLRLEIETDGSIAPAEALRQAGDILVKHFEIFKQTGKAEEKSVPAGKETKEKEEAADASKTKVKEMRLSSRTITALDEAGIKTAGGLSKKTEEALSEVKGMGEKGIKEIRKALKKLGLTLKD